MADSSIGEVIQERYELLEVIGRGGQGSVYKARDRVAQRDVAIKLIEGRAARDPETVERMAREQQALVALAGTHAVQFFDLCTSSNGALCLVMELLDGQDLESYLVTLENRGEKLSSSELVEILNPIATTLTKAHLVGIVHRDLKPGNIFLLTGGGSRLLDFGFARLTESRRVTRTGMVMGSPSYIAPEMWKGQGADADHRVDVYGFGVIVYRALSGELPFPNQAMHEILVAATRGERPSLHARRPDLPASVDAWVARVLAIDVEHRFPSIRAAWEELLTLLNLHEARVLASGATTPPPELEKIREWLETPPSREPVNTVWGRAAAALKRLVGSEPLPAKQPAQKIAPQKVKRAVPDAPGQAQGAKRLPKLPPPLRIAGLGGQPGAGNSPHAPEPTRVVPPPLQPLTPAARRAEAPSAELVDLTSKAIALPSVMFDLSELAVPISSRTADSEPAHSEPADSGPAHSEPADSERADSAPGPTVTFAPAQQARESSGSSGERVSVNAVSDFRELEPTEVRRAAVNAMPSVAVTRASNGNRWRSRSNKHKGRGRKSRGG